MKAIVRGEYSQAIRGAARGQALVIFALFSLVLVGMLALSIDGGFLLSERRQTQSAADAAAMAAAQAARDHKSASDVTGAGLSYGTANAGSTSTITINRPPTSGTHAGDSNYIEAIVTKPVAKYFLGAVYTGTWQVTSRAVAGVEDEPKPYALLALRAPGIYINGTTNIYIDGQGSAMSNSNILNSGNSNIFSAGGSIDANGTIQGNSNWSAGGGIHPGTPLVTDPLSGTPAPPKVSPRTFPTSCNPSCTLLPGSYSNLGTFTVPSNSTATLSSGVYYFDGNTRLNLQSTNSWIRSGVGGVLLYFTGTARLTPGNGNVDLRTASSSLYTGGVNGMVLWIANCSTFDASGNGSFSVEGVIYAPCSHVELHGTPTGLGIQVIVGDLVLRGTSTFLIHYREWVKASFPKIYLVE